VAPDLRGYNESEKPASIAAYAMPELVADVAGLVSAFGERDAAIVGHDWGGAIAWSFAMDRPALTRRLAVLNCPHPAMMAQHLRDNPRQLARSWYMFFFQIPWLPEFLLGRGHAWPIARAIRRSTVQQDAITDDDLIRLRDAAMHSARCAARSTIIAPRSATARTPPCSPAPCNGSSTATSRCRPRVTPRRLANDRRTHPAHLGRAGRRTRQGAHGRDGAAFSGLLRGPLHP
jgi:pimeloyl-ACP methyl ester carboxylesterase